MHNGGVLTWSSSSPQQSHPIEIRLICDKHQITLIDPIIMAEDRRRHWFRYS